MENLGDEVIFMKDDVERKLDEVIEFIKQGNLRGSRTRFMGIRGDIESAFGWHYSEKGQPKTDNSVTDLDKADLLDKVLEALDESKIDMDKRVYEDIEGSTPREMKKWMEYKRNELRGSKTAEQLEEERLLKISILEMLEKDGTEMT